MSYQKVLTEDRRLVLLRVLADSSAYTSNEYTLLSMVYALGHAVSSERLYTDLAWLAEQGLLTLSKTAGVSIATLSTRGLDVARGLAVVPGVQRPRPTKPE